MEIFKISNGTIEIDFLDITQNGIKLLDWQIQMPQWKAGGIYQDSPLSDGRQVKYRKYDTVSEPTPILVAGDDVDDVIANLLSLQTMLENAVSYWEDGLSGTPVYLIVKLDSETNTRYSTIRSYTLPELPYLLEKVIERGVAETELDVVYPASISDIDLSIEHGHWAALPPGTSTCVQVSNQKDWIYDFWEDVSGVNDQYSGFCQYSANGDLFVGARGNIYTSDDDGQTWSVSTTSPVSDVRRIIETASGTLLGGDLGSGGGVWRSTNGGGTWNNVSLDVNDQVRHVIETDTGRIIAATDSSFYYSDDDGASFSAITGSPTGNSEVRFFKTPSGRIFSSDGFIAKVMYSDDDGDTWTQNQDLYTITSLTTGSNNRLIGVVRYNDYLADDDLMYSDDDGDTWTLILAEPSGGSFDFLYTNSSGHIMLGGSEGLYRSGDNGLTFELEVTDLGSGDGGVWHIFETSAGTQLLSVDAASFLDIFRRYNGSTVTGRAATCDDEVYVNNGQAVANLTHIFVDDGGSIGSNLIPMSSFPVQLLPSTPATDDAVYFGISDAVSNAGGFSNVVLDLDPLELAASGPTYEGVWEYISGAGPTWSALDVTDKTSGANGPFTNSGVCSVAFDRPDDWTVAAVNGIDGYWIRYRISNLTAGGITTPPSQQNRTIYAANLAHVEIDSSQVSGKLRSLVKAKIYNVSDYDGRGGDEPDLFSNRTIVATRKASRGENFAAAINMSNIQNPAGVSVSLGTNCTFEDDSTSPSGKNITYNPVGVESIATRAEIVFSRDMAMAYYGRFRVFLRAYRASGDASDFDIKLKFSSGSGGSIWATKIKQLNTTTPFELLDFGAVSIPTIRNVTTNDIMDSFKIEVQASAEDAGIDLVLYDLWLLPADECIADLKDSTNVSGSDTGNYNGVARYLEADSTLPKCKLRVSIKERNSDHLIADYVPLSAVHLSLAPDADQLVFFLSAQTSEVGNSYYWIANPNILNTVQFFKNDRYLILRGNS